MWPPFLIQNDEIRIRPKYEDQLCPYNHYPIKDHKFDLQRSNDNHLEHIIQPYAQLITFSISTSYHI